MNKKLGYYSCNGIEFESKIRAAVYGEATKQPIKWHFNEDHFSKFPWHIEPEWSLTKLYDLRSRQIREEYDYVVICYSGGSDSNNIVESFIRQGLHIDEIVSNWPLDMSEKFLSTNPNEKSSWNVFGEFKLHTAGRLDYIKNKCPRTKIRMFDTSDLLIKSFLNAEGNHWVLDKKEVLNPAGSTYFNYTHFNDIRKQFDKDKKIAMVVGVDKPRCQIIDNNFYLYFVDKVANMVNIDDHLTEYPNATPLYYYWDTDSSLILAKQAHTILKWLKSNPGYQRYWETRNFKHIREIHEPMLKPILYADTWNTNWYQTIKPSKDWYCELDSWFLRGYSNTKEYQIWKAGIDYIAKKIPSFVFKDEYGRAAGTTMIASQNYFVGSMF
jgi:hypothetical protein